MDTLEKLRAAIPLLPGHSFVLDKKRVSERKSHAFDYCNSVPIFREVAPGIGGIALTGQDKGKITTSLDIYPHSKTLGENLPAWVAFDRKVLRFYGYFQEAVHERREEQYRIRKVNIYFYLDDDTIHVSEPKTANSGIPQGTLIRRHRIPQENSEYGQHFTVKDINVDKEVTFYSKTFKIVGCDDFTRTFLDSISIKVPPNTGFPLDPYTIHRNELMARLKATRPSVQNTSLRQFLESDRKVLRFYCVWDDTNSVFGDVRHMVLHYYLSDDTMEIKESIPPNSGRETNALFLRRGKLPKRLHYARVGGRIPEKDEYYTDRDLTIGSVLHFYGRPFVICDVDDYTKSYYEETYGLDSFNPVRLEDYDVPSDEGEEEGLEAGATLPKPSNIALIGSETAPKKDFKKAMKYDGVTLRFSAILKSTKNIDQDRRFVISLFLADDTISVFEPKTRDTGIMGGKFLEQRLIKKGGSDEYYLPADFCIGAELVFYNHPFIITGADNYALKFMDTHPELFPKHGVV